MTDKFITVSPRGTALLKGAEMQSPVDIPAEAKFVLIRIDRRDMLDGTRENVIEYGFTISLDGGIKWGGTFTENHVQYPLEITGSAHGVSVAEFGKTEESARGVSLPMVGSKDRKAKVWVRTHKACSCGVDLVFS